MAAILSKGDELIKSTVDVDELLLVGTNWYVANKDYIFV